MKTLTVKQRFTLSFQLHHQSTTGIERNPHRCDLRVAGNPQWGGYTARPRDWPPPRQYHDPTSANQKLEHTNGGDYEGTSFLHEAPKFMN